MAPGPTQAKFYDRPVTYGTDRAGLWVRRACANANGNRLSYQVMTGCYGLSVTCYPLQHGSGVRWLLRTHGNRALLDSCQLVSVINYVLR